MPGGERVVLADEGEGESEESDPILVTEEANVGGNAGVSTGPSTLSTATAAPRSSGTIGSTPAAPQPSTSRPRKPRWDTVGTVFRELAGIDLATKNPTLDDVKGAVALMQQAGARDTHARAKYAARLSAFELYIKHSEQAQAGQAFARDHLPPPQPSHLAEVVPHGAMLRAGAPAANNAVTQFAGLFKSNNHQRQDDRAIGAMSDSLQGRGFGAYPLLLNGFSLSHIKRDSRRT